MKTIFILLALAASFALRGQYDGAMHVAMYTVGVIIGSLILNRMGF